VGEKEFVWGSKQARQNYMCKGKEGAAGSSWSRSRLSPDQLRVKAAVSAHVVEFFKKSRH